LERIRLLFTCPHSGEKTLDKVRDSYPPTCEGSFTIENDALTSELTESICMSIEKISGKVPYSVIAEVHRMYVDYNRTQECAFEESSIIARDAYLEYHDRILQKIEEMLPQNSNDIAFLFDIHGTERLKVNGDFIEVIIGTIQTYGSKRIKRGLVAIQIEVIRSIRNGMYCRNKFGADMADCIFNFVNLFVSAPIP
jgi:hypothetical protein